MIEYVAPTSASTPVPPVLIEDVAPAPAVKFDEPSLVIEYVMSSMQHQLQYLNMWCPHQRQLIEHVAPAPAVTFTAPAPVIEYLAPTPAVTFYETAPAIENVVPASAFTCTALSPVTKCVAPAPDVTHPAPAPVIEYVMPSLVIEYIAFTPFQQFPPAYTMAADTTGLVKSQRSIIAVEASAAHVVVASSQNVEIPALQFPSRLLTTLMPPS